MRAINNIQEYKDILATGKPVLLDFYADWCGPCKALLPTIEKLATKHESDFIIAKVNVDTNQELSREFGVRSIPTLAFLKNGSLVEKLVGMQSENVLEAKIKDLSVVKE